MSNLKNWLSPLIQGDSMTVRPIPWEKLDAWNLQHGQWSHRTGGFFSLIGLQFFSRTGRQVVEPFIHQPEVGILGCLVFRKGDEYHWLIQAKSEPGSIPFAQAAPTVQATESNYKRRHGGKATRHLEHFLTPNKNGGHPIWHSCAENSEQGSKFLQKFNRNVVIELAPEVAESLALTKLEKWHPGNALKVGLGESNLINTDLRSVVVTSCWQLLLHDGEKPFSSPSESCNDAWADWRAACAFSYAEGIVRPISELRKALCARSTDHAFDVQRIPIQPCNSNVKQPPLPGWRYSAEGEMIEDTTAPSRFHDVVCLETKSDQREVDRWSQPLLRGTQMIHSSLLFRLNPERTQELQCFLRRSMEPGLRQPEWGPSLQSDNELMSKEEQAWLKRIQSGEGVMSQIEQTDEGGRFYQSKAIYSLVALQPQDALLVESLNGDFSGIWVNIRELERIVQTPGMSTNELRTAVSLLLSWI